MQSAGYPKPHEVLPHSAEGRHAPRIAYYLISRVLASIFPVFSERYETSGRRGRDFKGEDRTGLDLLDVKPDIGR
jgi:hypothetical protein